MSGGGSTRQVGRDCGCAAGCGVEAVGGNADEAVEAAEVARARGAVAGGFGLGSIPTVNGRGLSGGAAPQAETRATRAMTGRQVGATRA